ncbi:excalibur calcium-binding domain-containing protein [Neisseria yangbaofengii]|uniref:excalibur calcium-binding domain-containing protein n=1 Tax=Neisseria yangbaofengii TaxID=2709396 RepID=UPI0013ED19B8|nr:excalibur calcium-binding domain-containing protein [Neisseria yangbaofengii]
MRYYGTIVRWNESRRFGAIREESTENEIFVAFSAFNGDTEGPFEGQRVSFYLANGRQGRSEAQDVRFVDDFDDASSPSYADYRKQGNGSSRAGGVLLTIALVAALLSGGWYGRQAWQSHHTQTVHTTPQPDSMVATIAAQMKAERKAWNQAVKSPASAKPSAKFSCDGRQYCSQMNSREEAEFFIRHCPNTKMDGDNDGIPCENRW